MYMNSVNLIAKHLDRSLIDKTIHECDTVCTFTGERITQGIRKQDIIGEKFTDFEFLRYPSDYCGIDAALCMLPVIRSANNNALLNPLRNYHVYVTPTTFRILQRHEIIDLMLTMSETPFVLCVTFSNKKHTAFKSVLNYSAEHFTVTTDKGNAVIARAALQEILPVIQSWYTVVAGKEETSAQTTYFTKDEILRGCSNYKRIIEYGQDRYFAENKIINKYRNSLYLELITFSLNKGNSHEAN